jgi:peptidoglycan/xylan/chitin deacetylase (PgdA/CDA1 family)
MSLNSRNSGIDFQMSSARPAPAPPSGRPLVVHLVVNIECWRYDSPMPRSILPAPHGVVSVPDVPNFGWVEYGLRCGLPRMLELFAAHGVRASASMNAAVISEYPQVASAVLAADWEIIGHGFVQRALTEDDEAAVIEASIAAIAAFTGTPPRGWLSPGLQETFDTAAILRSAGIDYVCDWILDDLPVWIATSSGPLLAVPYSLELNDSLLHAVQQQPSDELHRRLVDTLRTFDGELSRAPRIVTLGLHPHLLGVPHRFVHLVRCIEVLKQRQDAVFLTGSEIADWYSSACSPPTV